MSTVEGRDLDVLIFGGGAAGLWLLDELRRGDFRVVLAECNALGAGQTVASQGIIHGGLKYTLSGLLTGSAKAIREMPGVWRACLAGEREPRLAATRVYSDYCTLWRTDSLRSKAGMVGARAGLRSEVARLGPSDRPAVFASCPGDVFRVSEQVIDSVTFLRNLADRQSDRLIYYESPEGAELITRTPGVVEQVNFVRSNGCDRLAMRPRRVVLTAGEGNMTLRERIGLTAEAMQRRPLHMVMVRGDLPELWGHCVDGARTRVTITSADDSQGRRVWQIGGQVAEDGVAMTESDLIARARSELAAVLPDVSFTGAEWATYRIDRAEGRTATGTRPDDPQVLCEGNVITAWPTKLALAPELARLIRTRLDPPSSSADVSLVPSDWPRPDVALPPWEAKNRWIRADWA
jgi:glycerol-3-phosphate dehydrogenase